MGARDQISMVLTESRSPMKSGLELRELPCQLDATVTIVGHTKLKWARACSSSPHNALHIPGFKQPMFSFAKIKQRETIINKTIWVSGCF